MSTSFNATASAAPTTASNAYKKLTQLEHILLRADTYLGSKELETVTTFVPSEGNAKTDPKMELRDLRFVPAFFKIFDEILVNAADNKVRDPCGCSQIKVDIKPELGEISVWNNGKGVPVEIHEKEGIYIPEMIFGHLLTGSNFDDDEKKVVGGRNGYGAKLANIYSTNFTVETHDSATGRNYKQTWTENMSICGKPRITEAKGKEKSDYTKITFRPDFARLNMTRIDQDTEAILSKRVYDLTGSLRGVRVMLNGNRIKIGSFKEYVAMYLGTGRVTSSNEAALEGSNAESDPPAQKVIDTTGTGTGAGDIVYERVNDRWEIAVALSQTGAFQQVSFVNSISTTKGGTHVSHVADSIVFRLTEAVKKKDKNAIVKPAQIKNQIFLFINCLIENPTFDSQTKENMTMRPAQFGSSCTLSEAFFRKVGKLGIIDATLSMAREKEHAQLKKTDGQKRSRLTGIVKLDDANDAGSRKAKNCTLFLTEGLSAKTFAVTGIPVIKNGGDLYGAYPLRGKLLNVRDASVKQKLENQEITELKQILGLQEGKEYINVDSLRYGRVCCLVDSDSDGKHIKGLILNWLESSYPSLLRVPGFLVDFVSPIVKCTKVGKQDVLFYDLRDYEEWKQKNDDGNNWTVKYFKGLGTSKAADIKRYFTALDQHLKSFKPLSPVDSERLDMVFSKKRAADRKDWLTTYDPRSSDFRAFAKEGSYSIADFIDKDLIEFSMYDNVRSIPSAIDGLKPGQRKILHTAFSVKLAKDIKVAQFAGDVAKLTEYRHGEQSLCETIVGMAQDFVGSNNIALLSPEGAFGTRLQGGKDAASPRYIYTKLRPIARKLFHPDDDSLLSYIVEDGLAIEPDFFVPILPMVLINGCEGIGTGYSTTVLPHDTLEIARLLRRKAIDPTFPFPAVLRPSYNNFTGDVLEQDLGRWTFTGRVEKIDAPGNTYEITELPVGTWTETYKAHLEKMISDELVRDYKAYHTDTTVRFVVKATDKLEKIISQAGTSTSALCTAFKLTATKHESNMMLFNRRSKLQKYGNVAEIMDEFYTVRIEFYSKRKAALLKSLESRLLVARNRSRFIQEIVSGTLVITARKRSDIESDLASRGYDRASAAGSGEHSYGYLLNMALTTLTAEKIQELKKQQEKEAADLDAVAAKTCEQMYVDDLDQVISMMA